MKNVLKMFSVVALILTLSLGLVACKEDEQKEVDFVSELKLDMDSNTLKQEVTVKSYIDGDTTHFYVPNSISETGVLKARYLAINTPESTGKIEEWGKKASNFTKEKLSNAVSIIIESDDTNWNLDSTGGRHLVWIWYKTSESEDYRNLNLEILQNGLAIASNAGNNRYGTTCNRAILQAQNLKLNVYSDEKDPDYHYGESVPVTLKEIRTNLETYNGVKVAFEGIVTRDYGQSVYVESYDEETDLYYGITVYYGYNLNGAGLEILSVGNKVKIVGTVQYYAVGGTYQVSGVEYLAYKPNNDDNLQFISSGNQGSYLLLDPTKFAKGKVNVTVIDEEGEEVLKEFDYASLIMNTTVSMNDLVVKSIYTTTNDDSSSKGAMTIKCEVNGVTINVRTVVLKDESGELITAEFFEGKTINVKGIVDYFDGDYQIKVFELKNIIIQ